MSIIETTCLLNATHLIGRPQRQAYIGGAVSPSWTSALVW
jgi:hypothetical protein